MKNATTPQSAVRAETIPATMTGDVITINRADYYIEEIRGSALALVRLDDLADGFTLPLREVQTSRRATEEERNRVHAALVAKANAEAAYRAGALVRTIKASKHVDPNTLYVIIKANAKTVSITELGGSVSGAVINAPRSGLAIVEPADVLK